MQNVEKTIEVICNWIQKQLNDGKCNTNHEISEMVKALAELVSASAKIVGTTIVEESYITDVGPRWEMKKDEKSNV